MAHMEGTITIATGILHLHAIPADSKRSACIHSLHTCAQTLTNSKPSAFSPPEADRTWGIEGLRYGDLILERVISTNPKYLEQRVFRLFVFDRLLLLHPAAGKAKHREHSREVWIRWLQEMVQGVWI